MDRYSDQFACFNDDIQGTGCVTLAAVTSALKVSGINWGDVRIVCFGAGSAGTGIADQLSDAIATEAGRSKDEAKRQIWYVETILSALVEERS
jgi:malate dehydrogenase (oxaloacetate-decarboxylating)